MNTTNYIRIFRGDDSDALGYQTIVGTIKTDLDLTGCKAVFRFLGFYAEFDPIPEDGKLTIVVPAQASRGFPPGVGYASLRVFDSLGKIRTFTNRIPVIVDTMTPSCGGGEFEVSFSPFPELEPLEIFVGPNADDFDQYTGFLSKIIDRASLEKYGLVMLADAMSEDGGGSGKAASPLAVKAAYDAIIKELTDNYYNATQTEEAIDRVAAYYITYDAAGNPFPTYAALANAQTVYSGGQVRVPTRNDYCVVLADETHQGAEYRYIYAVADGETTGSWQPQFPVEGVMTVDQTVQKNSQNPVSGGGVWSMLWGALQNIPEGLSSVYAWVLNRLGLKRDYMDLSYDTTETVEVPALHATMTSQQGGQVIVEYDLLCTEEVPDPPQIGHSYTWKADGAAFYVTQGVSALRTTWVLYSYTDEALGGVTTQNATQGFYPDVEFRPSNAVITIHKTTAQKQVTTEDTIALESKTVPTSRTVNGKALTGNVTLTGANIAVSGRDPTKIDAALAGKASKSDVDPLLFAQYYPEGNVKSAAEFTPGIKYDEPDEDNRTITVKPFCNMGDSENDNSGLVGRVVIPPFVDAQGNPYISDDGTRFRVIGVSDGVSEVNNANLTSIIAPSTVTSIGGVFAFCTSLTYVSLPAAEIIGKDALYDCTSLASVSLPAATTIGSRAFVDCSALTSVDFGDMPRSTVPSLGSGAFDSVPTTCKIIVPYTQYDEWKAADGWRDLPQEFVRHAEKADKPATFTAGNLAKFDANGNPTDSQIPASNVATKEEVIVADNKATQAIEDAAIADAKATQAFETIPYDLGTPIVINTASPETVEGETVYYGAATLANRTANIVQVTAATALDELRITFPAATSGKVRDFGLRVEIGTGSAALTAPALVPVAPTGETIKLENADGTIPALADGTATAKGVTLLYFSETASGVFVVKGEQVEEVA